MLELMRKHARNWLMKVLLGIIIIVFIFYFGSMGGKQQAETIAKIDGKIIAYVDLQKEYQNLTELYRQRFGGNLPEELLASLDLKQKAFDTLLDQAVVMAKAKDMGLEVTNEEVRASIMAYPAFQRNGVFNDSLYRQMLQYNKVTPEEFEAMQKKGLTTVKVETLIQEGIKVSEREVYDLYRAQTEKISVSFVQLAPADFAGRVRPTRADLEDYLRVHGDQFRVPEQLQVKVLAFRGADYAGQVKVTDDEVANAYESQKEKFTRAGKTAPLAAVREAIAAELRQVGGLYRAADEAKKAHDTIYQEENFDRYAAQNRLKVATTDFFPLNRPPVELAGIKDLAKTVFALQKGEVSGVLSDERSYYVLKVEARKPAYVPDLKAVEADVARAYTAAEAKKLCRREAEEMLGRLKKGEGFAALAGAKGLPVAETGFFIPGTAVPKLGLSQELAESLFQISEKKPYPDGVVEMGERLVLIRFQARQAASDAEFAGKKDALRGALLTAKRNEAVRSWLKETKKAMIKSGRLKITKDLKDL